MRSQTHLSAAILLIFACPGPLAVAAGGGSVAGQVQDASGGAIPNAGVRARNTATGVERRTITNSTGFYAFPVLPSGPYEVKVDHTGFRPFLQTDVNVVSDAALRVDVHLTVGTHNETVTVNESPGQIETANTHMGDLDAPLATASISNSASFPVSRATSSAVNETTVIALYGSADPIRGIRRNSNPLLCRTRHAGNGRCRSGRRKRRGRSRSD
jgi:hypothetical protein